MMEVLVKGAEQLGLTLSPNQVQQFEAYYHELVAWNQKFNLTTITSYDEVQAKHFVDSLVAIPLLKNLFPAWPVPFRVADVGAGAGMPGLPLKIAMPNIHLALIESTAKKAAFLSHVVDSLGIEDVEIIVGRAEELAHKPDLRERFDLALARAVAALPALVELTLPFVRTGGFLFAYKGADVDAELKSSLNAVRLLGGKVREVKQEQVDRILPLRTIVIIEKMSNTPSSYPRRPGLPSKRPL